MGLQSKCALATVFVLGLTAGDLVVICAESELPPDTLVAKGPKHHKPPQLTAVTLAGTVESVMPNALKIKVGKSGKSASGYSAYPEGAEYMECTTGKKKTHKDSGVWTVYPKPKTQVLVEGTAALDYIHPGQTIEFTGTLDGDKVTETIDKLNVVPQHGHRLNIGGAPAAAKDGLTSTLLDGGKTNITARIQTVDGTALTAWVGEKTLHLNVSSDPQIHVESDDPKLIEVGAKITVVGDGVHGPNLCQADSLKVTLSVPLKGKKLLSDFKLPSESEAVDVPKMAEEQSAKEKEDAGAEKDAKPVDPKGSKDAVPAEPKEAQPAVPDAEKKQV